MGRIDAQFVLAHVVNVEPKIQERAIGYFISEAMGIYDTARVSAIECINAILILRKAGGMIGSSSPIPAMTFAIYGDLALETEGEIAK